MRLIEKYCLPLLKHRNNEILHNNKIQQKITS